MTCSSAGSRGPVWSGNPEPVAPGAAGRRRDAEACRSTGGEERGGGAPRPPGHGSLELAGPKAERHLSWVPGAGRPPGAQAAVPQSRSSISKDLVMGRVGSPQKAPSPDPP